MKATWELKKICYYNSLLYLIQAAVPKAIYSFPYYFFGQELYADEEWGWAQILPSRMQFPLFADLFCLC